MDNENGFSTPLGILAMIGMFIFGEWVGKKNQKKQDEDQLILDSHQNQLNEINRLKQENEELKSKIPKIISSDNDFHFPLRL